ncbi:pseudouridine synthase [Lactarius hatsudake]|nr:pseudouridine synthase [Lactarius hatsudake]
MLLAAMAPDAVPAPAPAPAPARPGLRKIAPYWYPYTTMAKGRWLDREILEIVSTEFRDRSIEYYRYALESGVTTINGKIAKPGTIVRNGDRIENVVHRHEPPVTSRPVKILHEDRESEFIVIDKPGSIPVHATGRYFYLSLVEILQREFGYHKVYTVNRLDRLTSGLMIIGLSSSRAHVLSQEFVQGEVKKEYIARCSGEFPAEEVVVDQPLLTVDRQMGLNIVHPDGKAAKTIFTRLHYDKDTNTSVLHCRPLTGRSHQIRVHLQYLGYPIANDPVYSETKIWAHTPYLTCIQGPNLGKGGVDTTPSDDRAPPVAPAHLVGTDTADSTRVTPQSDPGAGTSVLPSPELLPRETGKDIGMGSPVPLSAEAVGVITRLRNMKDEDEDWSRWRDVVFKAKGRLHPTGMPAQKLPPQNRRKRGGPAWADADKPTDTPPDEQQQQQLSAPLTEEEALAILDPASPPAEHPLLRVAPPPDAPTESGRAKQAAAQVTVQEENDGALYCGECYLPLHPDPSPERLYIFLHALRYTTSLGVFETEMPEWAAKGWQWERSS